MLSSFVELPQLNRSHSIIIGGLPKRIETNPSILWGPSSQLKYLPKIQNKWPENWDIYCVGQKILTVTSIHKLFSCLICSFALLEKVTHNGHICNHDEIGCYGQSDENGRYGTYHAILDRTLAKVVVSPSIIFVRIKRKRY